MPSFDIVSELDAHEVTNAVDQINRELDNRYDFKGVDANVTQEGDSLQLQAEVEFQLAQILEIVRAKLTARKIDIRCMEVKEPETANLRSRQQVILRQGLDQALGKKINKLIKDSKLKVQSQIQGDKVRVTGKKRDDLQQVMAMLKESDIDLPLQFNNFRD